MVLVGGDTSGNDQPAAEFWTFLGGVWSQLTPPSIPPATYFGWAEYDGADQYVLLLTCNTQTGGGVVAENYTWAYAPDLASHATATPSALDLGPSVRFVGNGSGGIPPYSYAWRFGDGAVSGLPLPSHSYSTTGAFSVNLTVTDALGITAGMSLTVRVNAAPSAQASAAPGTTDENSTASFACRTSNGTAPFDFAWRFGDGGTASGNNVTSHSYATAGTFPVVCTATDAVGVASTSTVSETVHALPSVSFAPMSTSTAPGVAIAYAGTASLGTPPYSFHWDFGDGMTASTQNVSHGFTATGSYVVSLTVTDAVGGIGKATTRVTVGSPSSGSVGAPSTTLLLLIGVVVLVVVAAVAILVMRSRKPREPGNGSWSVPQSGSTTPTNPSYPGGFPPPPPAPPPPPPPPG